MSKVCLAFFAALLCVIPPTRSQGQTTRKPVITGPIDNGATVVLPGTKHALAQPRFDAGAVNAGLKMTRVLLALTPSKETQDQLKAFMDRQQDKTSADYHHWLTPDEFSQKFGPAPEDVQAVKGWLEQQGIQVTAVARSGLWMELSGTSGQMERAFQTQMRQYQVNGEMHIANASELSIPAALSPVVSGVVSLHNFFKKPFVGQKVIARRNADGTYTPVAPNATLSGGVHVLTPGDYAKIYGFATLTPSFNGSGVKIGLIARSDISLQDFSDFRVLTNLPAGTISNVLTADPDPGFDPNSGDSLEATLDAQWAGAVAQGANLQMIVSSSTLTTDGVDLSAAYAVDHNLTDILSVSFGQCEANIGATENNFFNALWQQAAAQGISVFVSSGDNGAAGCDPQLSNTPAVGGQAVSGLASTIYNTAVGGTEFNEGANTAAFWSATNGPGGVSATGYIPEAVWNETCNPNTVGSPCVGQGFFLSSGSGGKSLIYPKPTWQAGFPASPADTSRDLPDVSLAAAGGHDGYILCFALACEQNFIAIVGGTSAASPSFAGIMALVDQTLGGRQGLANYALYRLARNSAASCNSSARTVPSTPAPAGCIFNDVTTGNNSVPGLTGFNAVAGFDLATGLGSVNVVNLLNGWSALQSGATNTTLSSNGGTTITAAHGALVPFAISVTGPAAPAPTGAIALVSSLSGPVDSVALTSPAGSATGTFAGNLSNLPGGTYSLTAQYPGDSLTAPSTSNTVSVTISPESSVTSLVSFGLTAQGVPVQTTTFPYGGFMDLHAVIAGGSQKGIATGTVDFKDSATVIGSAPVNGDGQSELFFFGNPTPVPLAPGVHALVASYEGDPSFNASASTALNITVAKGTPTVAVVQQLANFAASEPGTLTATVSFAAGPILPTGTVQFLDGGVALGAPVAVNGSTQQATLTTTFANEGPRQISASYSGDANYLSTTSPVITVNVAPPFEFLFSNNAVTIAPGQTATYNLTLASQSPGGPTNFSGTVALTCSGAPANTTCSISPASLSLTGTNSAANPIPFTVTVTSTTSAALHNVPFRGVPIFFGAMFAIAISLKGKRKRYWQMAVVAVLALGISACGGGSGTNTPGPNPIPTPTPATQSTIVVTGTSGTHVSTLNLTLTITH